jgi:hypothetical protein
MKTARDRPEGEYLSAQPPMICVIPLLIQEGWRAERRGGYPDNQKLEVEISTTPALGTPPLLN